MNRAKVKISVVIPAFNEEKLLGATLRSLQAAGAAFGDSGWDMEIVVCDNNSTDGTAGLARAAGARVVFEPVNQISRARNTGAAAAGGEWLVFLDADSRPTRELFAEVAGAIQSGRCLAGGYTMRMDERHFLGDCGTGLLEPGQPDAEMDGRIVYFLRDGGVPENRRVQRGIVRLGGN